MKRLLLACVLLFTAACGASETLAPTATVPSASPSPSVGLKQVTLLLSDPFTDQDVSVIFDVPAGWEITAGLSNARVVVIPTLKPLGEGNPSPAESVSQSVGVAAETVTVDGREVFVALGGTAPNAPLSLAVTLPNRNYFLQINVLSIFEGAPQDYREALQQIILSARLSE